MCRSKIMESFIPEIGEKVYFYGRKDLIATMIERNSNLGLFLFDNGIKCCYGLGIDIKWKI
jgi:hypothetical protein